MAETARRAPVLPTDDDDAPSLDPHAIERAYVRERLRRRARSQRRSEARKSHLRFWVTMLILVFVTALLVVASWHRVQTMFGV
jgi:hypothetical protein